MLIKKIKDKELRIKTSIIIKLLIIIIIFGAIGFSGFVWYSTKPQFCKACHIMKPYYEAWKTSTHNKVACVECHYAPGIENEIKGKWQALSQVAKYITGTWGTKPWAEIDDKACLRGGCHSTRLLKGKVKFSNIIFDHTAHLKFLKKGKKLKCTSCHSQIVQGQHIAVTTSTCFLCHFKDKKEFTRTDCIKCHSDFDYLEKKGKYNHKLVRKNAIDCLKCHYPIKEGNGIVLKQRCFSCHNEKDKIARFKNTSFLHEKHIYEKKVDCMFCHQEIIHPAPKNYEEKNCQLCHIDTHKNTYNYFHGKLGDSLVIDAMESTNVKCFSCHNIEKINHKNEKIKITEDASCMNCHSSKFGFYINDFTKNTKNKINILSYNLNKLKSKIDKQEFKQIKEKIDYLKTAKPIHNMNLTNEIILSVNEQLNNLAAKSGIKLKKLKIKQLKSKCLTCHINITDKKIKFQGKIFNHKPHFIKAGLNCENCHSPKEGHGKTFIKNTNDCQKCHHQQKRTKCLDCHQNTMNKTINFKDKDFKHFKHIQAGFTCQLCHIKENNNYKIKKNINCITCHHNNKTKNCEKCHKEQTLYRKGFILNKDMETPDIMAEYVNCEYCHSDFLAKRKHIVSDIKEKCAECHDDSYKEMFDDFNSNWIDSLNKKLKHNPNDKKLNFIKKARPIHNFNLSNEILE